MIINHKITKGKKISLAGSPVEDLVELDFPKQIGIQPEDFQGLKLKLLVHVGDGVKVGSPMLQDRRNPKITIVSPASGFVTAINRGEKRALQEVVIELDKKQESMKFRSFSKSEIVGLKPESIIKNLMDGGLWPFIRQRPFSHIANPDDHPKSIFVRAMSTDPLAIDMDYILQDRKDLFQCGLDILRKLTKGDTHLCIGPSAKSQVFLNAQDVKIHQFFGLHPTGNVSTHIHYIDPIKKGDIVWYINALDVLKIADFFKNGYYIPEQYVALSGEGISNQTYVKTINGASLKHLIKGREKDGSYRYISGSILSGKDVGKSGFLRFYDSQISVIPKGGKRKLLAWLMPGKNRFTFSKTFVSSFLPERELPIDTDVNGGLRAIVCNNVYDDYNTLDILTFFLVRAVLAGEIEEAEQLGILESDEEDFALCTVACPSKVEIGKIIREGLDLIEREG